MQPAAHCAAAIEILDHFFAAQKPIEKVLKGWARNNRFAGSKDRAAIRDIVFDCLRCARSYAHASGVEDARGIVLGHVIAQGRNVEGVFSGEGYGPAPLSEEEAKALSAVKRSPPPDVALDYPAWLDGLLQAALGAELQPVMMSLRSRAPVDLRVNPQKTTRDHLREALTREGIETVAIEDVAAGLRLSADSRKLTNTQAFHDGWFELQDAGAQKLVEALPVDGIETVLDYCAGGGGKSLAYAAHNPAASIEAYDISQARMADLAQRAQRAGAKVNQLNTDPVLQPKEYDLIIADVPCSGSGSWRRNPAEKWMLTPERLEARLSEQKSILNSIKKITKTDGYIAYMTCSVLACENTEACDAVMAGAGDFTLRQTLRLLPGSAQDGFFLRLYQKTS